MHSRRRGAVLRVVADTLVLFAQSKRNNGTFRIDPVVQRCEEQPARWALGPQNHFAERGVHGRSEWHGCVTGAWIHHGARSEKRIAINTAHETGVHFPE